MALDPCSPCEGCIPGNIGNDQFKQAVLITLCAIQANTGEGAITPTYYDIEILCDPVSGDPVILRYAYEPDGTNIVITAWNLDGTAYAGVVADLVACSGGGGLSGSDFDAAFPASGLAVGFTDGTNMQSATVFDADTGAGTEYVLGTQLRFAASGGSTAAPGDATDGLLVNLGTNNDVTVTGTVTANAGTNLNTSLLALESGGNLATLAGATYLEDSTHASGNRGMFALGVYQQNGAAAFVGTPLDYCPFGVTSYGALNVNLDKNFRENASASAIKAEDEPSANTDALVGAGFVREDTPTTNTSASGDWTPAKTTAQGVLWERPYINGTVTSTGGSASSSGNNTLVAAGTNRLKVSKFSLSTTSTTAVTCIFQSGASGTELWRVVLQAATSTSTGANLAVPAPDFIFATAAATLLNLNLSSAQTVHWSVGYVDEP